MKKKVNGQRKFCRKCLIARVALVMAGLVVVFVWQGMSGFMG